MTQHNTLYQNLSIEKNGQSEVLVRAEIPVETAARYRPRALKKLQDRTDMPGFRKGHIPERVLRERVGEQAILTETAQLAMADVYPAMVRDEKLQVVSQPQIQITKLAEGNPIGFSFTVAVYPEVKLPDYRAAASEIMQKPQPADTSVSDKEVEDVLLQLRTNKWRIDNPQRAEHGEQPKESELPALTDELARGLGDFRSVEDFKTKLRTNLKADKERRARDKRRMEIGEGIIAAAEVPVPPALLKSELSAMLGGFKHDVERTGTTLSDYLAHIGKTEADLQKEWQGDAKKRVQLQLVLAAIAEKEHITADKEEVERQVEHFKAHHSPARSQHAGGEIDPERLRTHITTMLRNEAVFQLLEGEASDARTKGAAS